MTDGATIEAMKDAQDKVFNAILKRETKVPMAAYVGLLEILIRLESMKNEEFAQEALVHMQNMVLECNEKPFVKVEG